ncbi:hypothetical protein PR003_g15022 [Phytophthora rubi]|uniref:Uncharacterized protein n=2 Tax=Phytophthora TaxID=4783 RepID=A0A6A3LD12_9STRA|nr:hypothetical protein PR002_g14418 [Phytophthora rubi]KAE9019601.1 hypothetical protein PR001_g13839 [Phytophthora rubi]KAE9330040.1 hypothetical protein PF008_g15801 [Phytophthora fragariae]KAE9331405.1 hypothetical protein PR003_g15022 [Phytophthora rubi]
MVKDATLNGPLRLAVWLHNNFPGCVPADLKGVRITCNSDKFEMLLFQYEHYPHLITPDFAADTLAFISRFMSRNGSSAERLHMVEWLKQRIE